MVEKVKNSKRTAPPFADRPQEGPPVRQEPRRTRSPPKFFWGPPVEEVRKEPPKQLHIEDVEEGDDDFKRDLSAAIRYSIAEAAAKGYFDSDED
ncbi:hypothetical protein CEXT_694331 [Caerostris extrusa]|uniref:Uncharacterized protein n=1 Tax=Caerostris extrusa TaxID=172846 RepID=A0AAV4Y193_CAEEX|nr:hypothetical protein CEXT_694331 [Caerostris extrusa]